MATTEARQLAQAVNNVLADAYKTARQTGAPLLELDPHMS